MISVLQKLSSQLREDSGNFISGACEGDFDLGDGKFASKIIFEVTRASEKYLEWLPRDLGGGLARVHGEVLPSPLEHFPRSTREELGGRWLLTNGNVLQKYVTYDSPAGQLTLTQFSADYMGELAVGKTYRLSTVLSKSFQGYAWYGIRAEELEAKVQGK